MKQLCVFILIGGGGGSWYLWHKVIFIRMNNFLNASFMLTGCLTTILIALQLELVVFIALNSYLMVAWMKNVDLGTRDWKLLLGIISLPIVNSSVPIALGFIGPSTHHFWFVDNVYHLLNFIQPYDKIV